ncbi:MAG: GNAT family N-acetyltransferase, partial [Phycisphaerales bacterium]|nr:GNAT family N-acetyltransferase [Phycisphaerales bacterium]
MMVRVRRISLDDPLYAQECDLRERVLLEPLGYDMDRFRREFQVEDLFEHFVATFEHPTGIRVVGCVTLLPDRPEEGTGKLAQMAVDPQRQGEGIGRRLVVAVESRAFGELGLERLMCHAREDAIPFYARLGWVVDSDVFEEAGI